ncbi:unnamed protein product [Rotaria sp. Silwood1]|nr:unnamed protein product [Rotaria sp. Silwood1]CAF1451160.1 unnamed protein product [Rotaria sp. Silwood1]CAF3616210.1 unnamed protein product [Rotaria sp. Silwood1]CAF3659225.1 unnamed protein product [Rotaria sp. Silwood1]
MATSTVTLYNILGVAKASDDVQLRITYRERIHQFKADRQKTPGNRTITAEQFRQICRAYERLSDHDKRKQINAQDPVTGHTPLYCAACTCNVEAVHYLIEQGANPDLVQQAGSTALHVAAFYGYPEMVQCLLESEADYQLKNSLGNLAEHESYNDEVRNAFSALKKTPFVQAAANQLDWFKNNAHNIQEHIDVQYHVQRQTLLHCACKKGHFDLAKWLIEARSAKLDLVDINLNSALHLAAYGGHTSIVQYLLYRGANSTLINKLGMTAEQEGIVHGTRITGCGLKQ